MDFKWARWGRGSTGNPTILPVRINTSSIMVRNVPSIMRREAGAVTSS